MEDKKEFSQELNEIVKQADATGKGMITVEELNNGRFNVNMNGTPEKLTQMILSIMFTDAAAYMATVAAVSLVVENVENGKINELIETYNPATGEKTTGEISEAINELLK